MGFERLLSPQPSRNRAALRFALALLFGYAGLRTGDRYWLMAAVSIGLYSLAQVPGRIVDPYRTQLVRLAVGMCLLTFIVLVFHVL